MCKVGVLYAITYSYCGAVVPVWFFICYYKFIDIKRNLTLEKAKSLMPQVGTAPQYMARLNSLMQIYLYGNSDVTMVVIISDWLPSLQWCLVYSIYYRQWNLFSPWFFVSSAKSGNTFSETEKTTEVSTVLQICDCTGPIKMYLPFLVVMP